MKKVFHPYDSGTDHTDSQTHEDHLPDYSDSDSCYFLDFYKAFDTVEHQSIVQSLHKFGFESYCC